MSARGLLAVGTAQDPLNTVQDTHHVLDDGEDSVTPTVAGARHRGPVSSSSLPPTDLGDRYEIVEFIGAGGMGKVFKARDPRLGRYIALKFILYDDPELVRRLLAEARAQARVRHENICKVYEVGEANGHPYVAMQLIEGESLRTAKWKMSLEQKVAAVADVAEALHAAHRIGLIHRDIKPANIMIERDEEGALRPYILDFGLAREILSEPAATGVIEGTISYIAPEQAGGDPSKLDRRADIFSIGATLYELLIGHPPLQPAALSGKLAPSSEDFTMKPPRRIDATIPIDLETIVMKCLERDPALRYESGRALAEDLRRFLDGEPILARRPTLAYVALKKARKNKALVAAAAVLLGSAVALGGAGLLARASAKEQAETARRLGQQVTEMELFLRTAHGLPIHDIGRERAIIRERMEKLEAQLRDARGAGEGPVRYALARGHLALREDEKAIEHLRRAVEAGFSTPEVDRALGLALGELYKKGLEEARRIADKELRDARRRELEEERLAPALGHLLASDKADVEPPLYIEALVASYRREHDAAIEKARAAFERSPWLYEAKKLEGDVLRERADEKSEAGKPDEALPFYERAREAYATAAGIARSDPSIYEAEASLWLQVMEAHRLRGVDPTEAFERVLAACARARESDPLASRAHSMTALAHLGLAIHKLRSGGDPRPPLVAGLEAGVQAILKGPEDAMTHDTVGNLHSIDSHYRMMLGEDPRSSIREAIRLYEAAIRIQPSFAWAWNDLGGAHILMGMFEIARGRDPRPPLQKAIEAFEAATRINKLYLFPHVNACDARWRIGKFEADHGLDPIGSLNQAVASCGDALAINPSFSGAHSNLGWTYLAKARYEMDLGRAAGRSLARAEASCSRAVELSEADTESHHCLGEVYALMAVAEPPEPRGASGALEKGRREARAMLELAPSDAQPPLLLGRIELAAARLAMRGGASPEASFASAAEALEQARRKNPKAPEVFGGLAELALARAEHAAASDPGRAAATAAEGIAALEASEAMAAMTPRARVTLGALYAVQARAAAFPEARARAARRARAELERALAEDAFLAKDVKPWLDEVGRLGGE
jgi:serine/threonine-protein kinase